MNHNHFIPQAQPSQRCFTPQVAAASCVRLTYCLNVFVQLFVSRQNIIGIQSINGRASSFVPALGDICVISSFYFRSSNIMTAMAAVTLNMRMYFFYALCVRLTLSGLDVEEDGPVVKLRQSAVRLCVRFSAYGLMLNVTSSAFTPC